MEWATLVTARHCGLNVCDAEIVEMGKKSVLLVRRFGRNKAKNGYFRLPYASALTVLGLDERDRAGFSYVAFLKNLEEKFPDSNQGEELFRRAAFNILCRNTDDHPRNHGVLWNKNCAALSPAFDITPTPGSPDLSRDFYLQMSIGPRGRLADINNLLDGCAGYGLDYDNACGILVEMAEKISEWKGFFHEAGVSGQETEMFEHSFDGRQRSLAQSSERKEENIYRPG